MTGGRTRRVAVAAAAVVATGGCGLSGSGEGSGDGGGERARVALERQRTESRELARVLLDGAATALPGAVSPTATGGGWRGCESGFHDEFRSFRYQMSARVDLAPSARVPRPHLAPLRAVLADAGLDATRALRPNGSATLGGEQGGLAAQFVHTGAGRFLLLQVVGECVDVPEGDRDHWLRRDEPAPTR